MLVVMLVDCSVVHGRRVLVIRDRSNSVASIVHGQLLRVLVQLGLVLGLLLRLLVALVVQLVRLLVVQLMLMLRLQVLLLLLLLLLQVVQRGRVLLHLLALSLLLTGRARRGTR